MTADVPAPKPYRHPHMTDAQVERVAALLRPYVPQIVAEQQARRDHGPAAQATGPLLMSSAQAAQHLGVSLSWLEKAVGKGQVQHTRVGRLVKFSQADLDAFVTSRVRPATLPPRRGGGRPTR